MIKLLPLLLLLLCSCEPPKPQQVLISGHSFYVLERYKHGLVTIHDPECPKCKEQKQENKL